MNGLEHLGSDFTTEALTTLEILQKEANARSIDPDSCLPELVFWVVLAREKNVARYTLETLGVDFTALRNAVDSSLQKKRKIGKPENAATVARNWATREASSMGSSYKGTEHLLLGAVAALGPDTKQAFAALGIDYKSVREAVCRILSPDI